MLAVIIADLWKLQFGSEVPPFRRPETRTQLDLRRTFSAISCTHVHSQYGKHFDIAPSS